MAQRPTRGNPPVQKQNPVPHEEDVASKPQEKPQTQGTIAVVRSKIREKDAPQKEEDSMASTKVTPSKITSRPKKLKRGSSSENILKDNVATAKKSDIKTEKVDLKPEEINAKPEADVKREVESKLDENQAAVAETKSKKSLAKLTQSKKSLGPREDDQTESLTPKKSEIKKETENVSTGPELSNTALPVLESQEQKPETPNLMKNIQSDFTETIVRKSTPRTLPSQKTQGERKNYLANLAPEPLDEYPADEEEPREAKDQDKSNKKHDSLL